MAVGAGVRTDRKELEAVGQGRSGTAALLSTAVLSYYIRCDLTAKTYFKAIFISHVDQYILGEMFLLKEIIQI